MPSGTGRRVPRCPRYADTDHWSRLAASLPPALGHLVRLINWLRRNLTDDQKLKFLLACFICDRSIHPSGRVSPCLCLIHAFYPTTSPAAARYRPPDVMDGTEYYESATTKNLHLEGLSGPQPENKMPMPVLSPRHHERGLLPHHPLESNESRNKSLLAPCVFF